MNAKEEREYVKAAYPNPAWKRKVDAMPDDQVIAIYIRLQNELRNHESDPSPDQGRLF